MLNTINTNTMAASSSCEPPVQGTDSNLKQEVRELVTVEDFWTIIDLAAKCMDPEQQLRTLLHKASPLELIAFQQHFDSFVNEADDWYLCFAASIIGHTSDDGFAYFRFGLVMEGREVYNAVTEDPDTMADLGVDETTWNEGTLYLASGIFEEKTGYEMPRIGFGGFMKDCPNQKLRNGYPKELAKRYPKVWKKFGKRFLKRRKHTFKMDRLLKSLRNKSLRK